MLRRDGTGPNGMGSMTGKGLGFCAGGNIPSIPNRPRMGYGRGLGGGRANRSQLGLGMRKGRGGGFKWCWQPSGPVNPVIASIAVRKQMTPTNQVEMLKQEKDYLESELTEIQKAIEGISKSIEELEKED